MLPRGWWAYPSARWAETDGGFAPLVLCSFVDSVALTHSVISFYWPPTKCAPVLGPVGCRHLQPSGSWQCRERHRWWTEKDPRASCVVLYRWRQGPRRGWERTKWSSWDSEDKWPGVEGWVKVQRVKKGQGHSRGEPGSPGVPCWGRVSGWWEWVWRNGPGWRSRVQRVHIWHPEETLKEF